MSELQEVKKIISAEIGYKYVKPIDDLEQELSKYKLLYQKGLDNTIKSDRELMKYKDRIDKAIDYIKKIVPECETVDYEIVAMLNVTDLLKILKGEKDER